MVGYYRLLMRKNESVMMMRSGTAAVESVKSR